MESIFDAILFVSLILSVSLNFVIYVRFCQKNEKKDQFLESLVCAITELTEKQLHVEDKIVCLSNGLDRSMLALREALEPTKPMKSNNWDSVRKAFTGPARIDIDERT